MSEPDCGDGDAIVETIVDVSPSNLQGAGSRMEFAVSIDTPTWLRGMDTDIDSPSHEESSPILGVVVPGKVSELSSVDVV